MNNLESLGTQMYGWAKDLFPICRSITGDGLRETLRYINDLLPKMKLYEVPSGEVIFDWVIPDEWSIQDAYIADEYGNRIIDFKINNLHLMGYSVPIDQFISLEDLQKNLYSLPDQPDAIPYVTSYYEKRWGFCLKHNQRMNLKAGMYHVFIDTNLKPGHLSYGELVIPGLSEEEIFISTYVCHPSMANNELSGPCVTACLARWLETLESRRYTYRIIFVPETIGSLTYIKYNLNHLKKNVIAGFNITCVGDERSYSYLPSRYGNTLSDRVALHALRYHTDGFKKYTFLDRGSDERQYCAPGIDLPIATIMRSKYGEYPEYHTSLDDLNLISAKGLSGGFNVIRNAIEIIEKNSVPQITVLGEPQLSKRRLYPTVSTKYQRDDLRKMMDILAYSDGKNTLLDIAEILNVRVNDIIPIYELLSNNKLLIDLRDSNKIK